MCVVCSHVLPPWRQGSYHSYEASRHFSLEPDVLDCAPRGASPHPGTCTSAETHTQTSKAVGLVYKEQLVASMYLKDRSC